MARTKQAVRKYTQKKMGPRAAMKSVTPIETTTKKPRKRKNNARRKAIEFVKENFKFLPTIKTNPKKKWVRYKIDSGELDDDGNKIKVWAKNEDGTFSVRKRLDPRNNPDLKRLAQRRLNKMMQNTYRNNPNKPSNIEKRHAFAKGIRSGYYRVINGKKGKKLVKTFNFSREMREAMGSVYPTRSDGKPIHSKLKILKFLRSRLADYRINTVLAKLKDLRDKLSLQAEILEPAKIKG